MGSYCFFEGIRLFNLGILKVTESHAFYAINQYTKDNIFCFVNIFIQDR